MRISGNHSFAASRERVWEALLDPAVLSTVLPGCEQLERTADDQFTGAMNLKVGPVQGKFQGTVQLQEPQRPESYTLKLEGRGAPGWVRASTRIELSADGDSTNLSYDGEAQVGGRIASVGQRLLDSSTRSIIRQSLEGLERALEARAGNDRPTAAGNTATTVSTPATVAAPSQAEFASRVAKDVARDLIPRPVLIGGLILLLLAAAYLLLN